MKNLQGVCLICILLISNSCKKDKNTEPTYPNYSMLKVGNYWVYERFKVDTLGNATSLNKFDSTYIEKDTIINGSQYFKMLFPDDINPTVYLHNYYRDSSGYTIDYVGNIYFSATDFTTTFYSHYFVQMGNDTVCFITTKMTDKDEVISVPAGSFVTSNYKYTYQMFPNHTFSGAFRKKDNRYSENVGCVLQTLTFYSSDPTYTEKRLKRYFVELPD